MTRESPLLEGTKGANNQIVLGARLATTAQAVVSSSPRATVHPRTPVWCADQDADCRIGNIASVGGAQTLTVDGVAQFSSGVEPPHFKISSQQDSRAQRPPDCVIRFRSNAPHMRQLPTGENAKYANHV